MFNKNTIIMEIAINLDNIPLIKNLSSWFTDEVNQIFNNRILEYLYSEYKNSLTIKNLLHPFEPVELKKIYQPLFLTQEFNFWEVYTSSRVTKRISTENIKNLFEKNSCITITGAAGSGKSTLVKYLFVKSIEEEYKIPIKVELRYLNDYEGDLQSFITEKIIKYTAIARKDRIIERYLEKGMFVIFLDGYDEVIREKKEGIARDINGIAKRYPYNNYLLTSRLFANIDMLEGFLNYSVCDLTSEEIPLFIKKQFSEETQEIADKIIETIKEEKNFETYKSFLVNPLLLTMFILTFKMDPEIPQKRSDYYYQVFYALYSMHDEKSKMNYVRVRKSGLIKENFIDILNRFSYRSFFYNKLVFSVEYFESQMDQIKKELKDLKFRNEDLMDDLLVGIGILTKAGRDITFPHRSLQEYFAALFVTRLTDNNKMIIYTNIEKNLERMLKGCKIDNYYLNFFSLLSEMNEIVFQKQIVIPILKYIRSIVMNLKPSEWRQIAELFVSIQSISSLLDKKMSEDFSRELFYNQKSYNDYRSVASHETTILNSDRLTKNNREKYTIDHLLPYLRNYKYDEIINRLEKNIKNTEEIEADYIGIIGKLDEEEKPSVFDPQEHGDVAPRQAYNSSL